MGYVISSADGKDWEGAPHGEYRAVESFIIRDDSGGSIELYHSDFLNLKKLIRILERIHNE